MIKKFPVVVVACLVFVGMSAPVFAQSHGEPPVKKLEQQFNDFFTLETTDDGEVKKYDSMDRLEEEMKSIMVWPLADRYLETYFYEENGKLYLKAMDGPVKLDLDKEYHMEKVDENHYTVTQDREGAQYGKHTVKINYSYEAGKWVLEDRSRMEREKGGEMPDTSTSLPVKTASGLLLTVVGALLLAGRKRLKV
ncbi:hypothetical protein [Halobacillus sp. BBL2006]|uniref:hypothetical protein n=1 Tax=Halobacillus sp. BBL2006 TaxID=1543706 RepID=UPI0005420A7E|nr:hypothetical protein [Halobacillus sp. BBL2006]KHE67171.1 hypothetical protein LD39_18920 [Halobacillus sp. BBL2006]